MDVTEPKNTAVPGQPQAEPFTFQHWPGIRLVDWHEGYVELSLPVQPGYYNRGGRLHGGMLYTLADIASGSAVMTYGHRTTTVTGSIDYLRAGVGVTTLHAFGRVVKHGGTLSVCEVELRSQEDVLIATAHMTFFNFDEPLQGTVADRFANYASVF